MEQKESEITLLLDMWNNRETERSYDFLIKGYFMHHLQSCKNSDCPLTPLLNDKKHFQKKKKGKSEKRNRKQEGASENIQQAMLNYINYEFSLCIQQNPDYIPLRLSYALFQIEKMRNSCSAIREIMYCEKSNPSFSQQFLMHQFKELIKKLMLNTNKGDSDKLTIATAIAYDNNFKQFLKKIEKTGLLHVHFWSMLSDDSPDMQEIMNIGFKILINCNCVSKTWDNLQSINPNLPKAIGIYTGYLNSIVNDKAKSKNFQGKAEDFSGIKSNTTKRLLFTQNMQDGESLTNDGTACVLVNGQASMLGKITDCNLSFSRIFGYNKKEILGNNISKLMPEIYAEHHDEIIQHSLEYGEDTEVLSGKDKLVFGKSKNHYIFPVWQRIIATPTLINNNNYIGLMNIDKTFATGSIAFVLLDKNFIICSVSSSAIAILHIDASIIKMENISFYSLVPEMFEKGNFVKFCTKSGSIASYFFPSEIGITGEHIEIICQAQEIKMGEFGKIGYCIKISIPAQEENDISPGKNLRYPDFQFRYDDRFSKFIREYKQSEKYILFIYFYSQLRSVGSISPSLREEDAFWEITKKKFGKGEEKRDLEKNDGNVGASIFYESIKSKLAQLIRYSEMDLSRRYETLIRELTDLLANKKINYGEGIITYRLENGEINLAPSETGPPLVINTGNDLDLFLSEDEAKQGKNEGKGMTGIFQIKSRETLEARIKEIGLPGEYLLLYYTSVFQILFLVSFSIALYILSANFLNNTTRGFEILQNSSNLLSSIQHVLYQVRECIITNNNISNNAMLMNIGSRDDYFTYLQNDIQSYKNIISDLGNFISFQEEIQDHSLPLYAYYATSSLLLNHSITDKLVVERNFSYPQIISFFLSNMFDVSVSDPSSYNDDDYNSNFLIHNGHNYITQGTILLSNLFMGIFKDDINKDMPTIKALFSVAICISALFIPFALVLLNCIFSSTQNTLMLFLDLPYKSLRQLNLKADRFLQTLIYSSEVDHDNDIDSYEDWSLSEKSTRRSRRFKNIPSFIQKAAILLIASTAIIDVIFGINFYLEASFRDSYLDALTSFNQTARIESTCYMVLNYERECFYNDPTLEIQGILDKCQLAEAMLELTYTEFSKFDVLEKNSGISTSNSETALNSILQNNLCSGQFGIIPAIPGKSCENFMQSIGTQVYTFLILFI